MRQVLKVCIKRVSEKCSIQCGEPAALGFPTRSHRGIRPDLQRFLRGTRTGASSARRTKRSFARAGVTGGCTLSATSATWPCGRYRNAKTPVRSLAFIKTIGIYKGASARRLLDLGELFPELREQSLDLSGLVRADDGENLAEKRALRVAQNLRLPGGASRG
jgi:hypothetical protein